jgi:O-antigen ligase
MSTEVLVLLAANMAILAIAVAIACYRRYELAIILVGLSPLISSVFIPNAEDVSQLEQLDQDAGIGSYIRVSLLLLIGAIGVLRYLASRKSFALPLHMKLMGFILIMALVSTSYSIDPQTTFVRAVSGTALFGFLLGLQSWIDSSDRMEKTINAVFLMIIIAATAHLASMFVMPSKAWVTSIGRFQGLTDHPNTMGAFCMLSYPVLMLKYGSATRRERWLILGLAALLLSLHLLTGSRGSLLPSAMIVCIWLLVRGQWAKLFWLALILVVGGVMALQLLPDKFERDDNDDIGGLTSRPEFWIAASQLIRERPLRGYGYAVEGKVWEDPRFRSKDLYLWAGSSKTSLHNGYISQAIGLGVIGLCIWCILLLSPLAHTIRVSTGPYRAFTICALLPAVIHNFIESDLTLGGSTGILFWVAWLIAGHAVLRETAKASKPASVPFIDGVRLAEPGRA